MINCEDNLLRKNFSSQYTRQDFIYSASGILIETVWTYIFFGLKYDSVSNILNGFQCNNYTIGIGPHTNIKCKLSELLLRVKILVYDR